jgi:predicted Holliday junction resolvase-like endonuclease
MSTSESLLAPLPVPAIVVVGGLVLLVWLGYRLGLALGRSARLRSARRGSLRSLAGKTAEQWAPYLEGFPGQPTEARFLGAPVDFVVFRGLGRGRVDEIVLVEVKSGDGQLSAIERSLRDCVREGRVSWAEHRVDAPEVS